MQNQICQIVLKALWMILILTYTMFFKENSQIKIQKCFQLQSIQGMKIRVKDSGTKYKKYRRKGKH